ncbi:MAG TPA: M28 family peptidase [Urbifossiella sp.]|nr:M28 family peptidase [Urbifossiella sp.]
MPSVAIGRVAVLILAVQAFALVQIAPAAEAAPPPRSAGEVLKAITAAELDKAAIDEVKAKSELMKNLEFLSDTIGPRLTGSKNVERANEWTALKMKEYGLENVKLEPWEIPLGWERGTATMTVVEPDTKVRCVLAAAGWSPSTKGKVTGEVVILRAQTKADLARYRGKLKNAVILRSPPARVAPVTDTSYGPLPPAPKKVEPKKAEPKKAETAINFVEQPAKEQPKKPDAKQPEPKKEAQPRNDFFSFQTDLNAFLKEEGVACILSDSAKPHGLLVVTGSWPRTDRGNADRGLVPDGPARVFMSHESYALLYRLASRPAPAVTKVEVEITNKFIPGPITVFNTVGEVKGSEKPDEFVVVGAHLDSWDLATGTMDNGTGTCVVLETARTVAALAKQGYRPKRTIRFCLFTGEEQGLHGSAQYVTKHADEMDRTSVALIHDTGTGKVTGFATHNHSKAKEMLDPELATLTAMDGWRGLDLGFLGGSDHQSFHRASVPGFACRQDIDEYRYTHHTQTDTFDHAKAPNLIQGAQVMAVSALRAANLPELLPRASPPGKRNPPRKKDAKTQ